MSPANRTVLEKVGEKSIARTSLPMVHQGSCNNSNNRARSVQLLRIAAARFFLNNNNNNDNDKNSDNHNNNNTTQLTGVRDERERPEKICSRKSVRPTLEPIPHHFTTWTLLLSLLSLLLAKFQKQQQQMLGAFS
mmetsp:Transcript_53841/g.96935  ORF Transcript_53841/g.96935 Transcript_53841/m.96935 type:complete len:135 (-) Transcript_53841:1513-1917(-)